MLLDGYQFLGGGLVEETGGGNEHVWDHMFSAQGIFSALIVVFVSTCWEPKP